MKKILLALLVTFILINSCNAKKIKVKLEKCIDGDTISISSNDIVSKVRFLAVNAPEIDKEEPYSIEAKEFVCNLINNGKNLFLEYDEKADKTDKYDRTLAWVWIDDTLIQKELIVNGYAKVAYLYDDYKYATELKEFEKTAKDNKINIWSDYKPVKKKMEKSKKDIILDNINKYYDIFALVVAMILALVTFYIRKKK